MLASDFWQDKANSQKVIKEKKLFEDLINSFEGSINKLKDLDDIYQLAVDENNISVKKEIFENIKELRFEKPDSTSLNAFLDNAYWSSGTEVFKLEYLGKKKSFGKKVVPKDANLLLRFINDRAKKWRKKA